MNVIKGDLIKLAKEGRFDVIVHGCNCFNTMGSDIAKQIKLNFPQAYSVDMTTKAGDEEKLGYFTFCTVTLDNEENLIVVNAYTQYNYGTDKIQVHYYAVRDVFHRLAGWLPKHFRIGYPKIGAGLAGGDWDTIAKIIDEELKGHNHTLVEYDPEG